MTELTVLKSSRTPIWPAVLVTVLTGMGFAGLKFVLIGEIALDFDPKNPPAMPFVWLDEVLRNAISKGTLKEAITQGLAAVLTLGVLIGYLVNAPLAGAWRVSWLFVLSSAGVGLGALLTLWFNPWLTAMSSAWPTARRAQRGARWCRYSLLPVAVPIPW